VASDIQTQAQSGRILSTHYNFQWRAATETAEFFMRRGLCPDYLRSPKLRRIEFCIWLRSPARRRTYSNITGPLIG
jgi:hypothetical protein